MLALSKMLSDAGRHTLPQETYMHMLHSAALVAVKKVPEMFLPVVFLPGLLNPNCLTPVDAHIAKTLWAFVGKKRVGRGGGQETDMLCTPIDNHTWSVKLWNDSDSSVLSMCNDIGHILLVINVPCRECTMC